MSVQVLFIRIQLILASSPCTLVFYVDIMIPRSRTLWSWWFLWFLACQFPFGDWRHLPRGVGCGNSWRHCARGLFTWISVAQCPPSSLCPASSLHVLMFGIQCIQLFARPLCYNRFPRRRCCCCVVFPVGLPIVCQRAHTSLRQPSVRGSVGAAPRRLVASACEFGWLKEAVSVMIDLEPACRQAHDTGVTVFGLLFRGPISFCVISVSCDLQTI